MWFAITLIDNNNVWPFKWIPLLPYVRYIFWIKQFFLSFLLFLRNAQHSTNGCSPAAQQPIRLSIDREEKFRIKSKVIKWDIWLVALTHLQWWRKRSGEAAGPPSSFVARQKLNSPNNNILMGNHESHRRPNRWCCWWWYRSWPGKFLSKVLGSKPLL